MAILKILLIMGLCAGGYTYYQKKQEAKAVAQAVEAGSDSGFMTLPPADGHNPASVIVVAPQGCSRAEAQRAEELAADLSRAGVAVRQTNAVNWTGIDPADIDRINSIMSGKIPIVFVGARAKNNPTLADVLAAAKAAGL